MIKEEKGKVVAGGSPTKLEALEKYRDQYQEKVNILTTKMQRGDDISELLTEQQVYDKVQHLYALKYYGQQLRQIKSIVTRTHGDTFREESHRVHVRAKRWNDPIASGYRGNQAASGHWDSSSTRWQWSNQAASTHWSNQAASRHWSNPTAGGHWVNPPTSGHWNNASASGHWGSSSASGHLSNASASEHWGSPTASGMLGGLSNAVASRFRRWRDGLTRKAAPSSFTYGYM